jgi:hypothetical protein
MRNLAVEANYIWRKYDKFSWSPRDWGQDNFRAIDLNPTNCAAQATCGPITYYVATSPQPSPYVSTNQPDRYRNYGGVELIMAKRYSDRWMANASFAYNNAKDYWGSPGRIRTRATSTSTTATSTLLNRAARASTTSTPTPGGYRS